jgi:hypothetical protein
MAPISEEDQRAKMGFIDAFFDDFDNKVSYLTDPYNAGRRDEARTLCSCYIDGLASALCWPDERTNYSYVKILKEHGGNEIFAYVHPKMLDEALNKLSKRGERWKIIHRSVSGELGTADRRLYEEHEILELFAPLLDVSAMEAVSKELWRGTFAAIIYDRFRVAAVHGFGPPDGTTFDDTTFQGTPVPPIDFFMVHDCLKRIVGVAGELSKKSIKWFGHDYE